MEKNIDFTIQHEDRIAISPPDVLKSSWTPSPETQIFMWRWGSKSQIRKWSRCLFNHESFWQPISEPLPMSIYPSSLYMQMYIYIYTHTGRTKVALVELPTVNMFGFFFCTSFPRRILAWSFVVPRSHFHPPKALKSYIFRRGWPSHTCHTKRTWKCDPELTETDVL